MSQQPPPTTTGYYAPYPPYAPAPQPRRPRPAWLTAIIVLVVLCVGLPVLSMVVSALGTVASHPGALFPTPAPPPPTPTPARVGATITDGGVSCTLRSARPLAGDQFVTPKAGAVFVVIRVTLTNRSGAEYSYANGDFHAKSSAGNITTEQVYVPSTYSANDLLESGTLTNGGTVTGDLLFEVPAHDHGAELTWSPWLGSDDTTLAWSLGR